MSKIIIKTVNGSVSINGNYIVPKTQVQISFDGSSQTCKIVNTITGQVLLKGTPFADIQDPAQAANTGFASFAVMQTTLSNMIIGTGMLIPFSLVSAATTNATSVIGSSAALSGALVTNDNANNKAYVKLYNKATAPNPAADVPVMVLEVPKASQVTLPKELSNILFPLGIAFLITGAAANTDTTAVGAGDICLNLFYQQ